MDLLKEIQSDSRHQVYVAWFKRLFIGVLVALALAAGVIVYMNKINERNAILDAEISEKFIRNCLDLGTKDLDFAKGAQSRPVSDLLKLSQINVLLGNKGETKNVLQRLENLAADTKCELIGAVSRIIWISLVMDSSGTDKPNKNQLSSFFAYFDEETKPFWARAKILQAIYSLGEKEVESAKATLSSVIYSQYATQNSQEEAKAVLSMINLRSK